MQVTMERVSFDDKQVFSNLLQLYLYDSSEYDGWDITEHGFFRYGFVDHYWTEDGRHPFFIRANGRLAGLAMVRTIEGPTPNDTYYSMAEFFVMRKYRGKGVGKQAALKLLDMFSGKWHIGQTHGNKPAQVFWNKLISDYTGGDFTEEELPDEDFPWMKGPVQKLVSKPRTLVYLIRHAQAVQSADEAGRPLTDKGHRDAHYVSRLLDNEKFDVLYSSPYRRAVQTLEPLAKTSGLKVNTIDAFKERSMNHGQADFDEAALKAWKDFDFCFPGGESSAAAQARGISALHEILDSHAGQRRLIITTFGAISMPQISTCLYSTASSTYGPPACGREDNKEKRAVRIALTARLFNL